MFSEEYEIEEQQQFCTDCESFGYHKHLRRECVGVDNETLYVIEDVWQCQNCGEEKLIKNE